MENKLMLMPPPLAIWRGGRSILQSLTVALGLLAFPVAASSDRPPVSPSPTLAAPADLTVDASDRRLAVSWRPVAGAIGYRVAARLMNGVEPFAWSEYDAASPPHAITDRWAAMSGMEYEVRVAAINDDGQPIWSPSVAVTAPALRRAPPGSLELNAWPRHMPHYVGDRIVARLADSQKSSTRRSAWMWSVCDPDGSSCNQAPLSAPDSTYLIGEAARGKRVQVQKDYDLGGVSWVATAVAGVVIREAPPLLRLPVRFFPPGCEETDRMAPSSWIHSFTKGADLTTHLHHLESKSVQIPWELQSGGGAIAPLCEDLLVVTPQGRIALVRPDGSLAGLEGRVPMNLAGMRSNQDYEAFVFHHFKEPQQRAPRVTDVLLKPRSEGRWELFVTHHHFTDECIRFRLSSTMVLRQGGSVSVSPSWRTVFDFEPCLVYPRFLHSSGGRILTDGPERLLVVVGDHGRDAHVQDPDSHLGKLVRIGIETGASEVLSLGLRNPQGFARDADGNLWETEHGPQGGDELNVLEPGLNYGWPWVSYGIWYGGSRIASVPLEWTGGHEAFARPVFAWVPSIAISAMTVNDDRWLPLWKDDLIVGSLKDRSIHRVRRNGTSVQYVERIEVGYRVRDLAWMPDGRLALLADNGAVHFLSLVSKSGYCNDPPTGKEPTVYTLGCGLSGWITLHSAAQKGHVEAIRLLLDRGADLETRSERGWTPLHSAANKGHVEAARLLLDRGADPDTRNKGGWTPLHRAANKGHVEAIRLLLDRGADLETRSERGWTPLHSAANKGHVEAARLLLDRGADPDTRNKGGWTPLHRAARKGHVEAAALLLDRGADLEARNKDGETPLDIAKNRKLSELVRLFEEWRKRNGVKD